MSAETTTSLIIKDDAEVGAAITEVAKDFMKDKSFDRLNATILVLAPDGTWRRGSVNPDALAYPASCVKLAYLAAAMHWCRENGHPYDYLDSCVRPMIEVSSNEKTGEVVDAITSAPNIQDLVTTSDARYAPWLEKRLYTSRYLQSLGLLENQTIVNKTYPSNTSSDPEGAEKVARYDRGMNKMQPRAATALMLNIAKGVIEPGATKYMRELLNHDRWRGNSVTGTGVPPGSVYLNKPGNAYDSVEDIAYVELPNGREFVLAAFTNSFRAPYISDGNVYSKTILGIFCEKLIERLGLDKGCPPKLKIDNEDSSFSVTGDWRKETTSTQFGKSFLVKNGGDGSATATWHLDVPEGGKYEVCVWYTQSPGRAIDVQYTVNSDDGTTMILVNQRKVGGRWFRLGNFPFKEGTGSVVVSDKISSGSAVTVAADAVRAIRWP